jgi:hypothetical protein
MSKQRPLLPANRAFVVQLHADAEVDKGHVFGRVEHIVSFQATHFQSVEELLAFIKRIMMTNPPDED